MSETIFADMADLRTLGIAGRRTYAVSPALVDMRRAAPRSRSVRLPALPQNLLFDSQRAAVIVIDMINDFCHPDGWITSMGVDIAPARALAAPINAVTAAARSAAMPVIFVNWGVRPDRLNLSPGTQHPFNPHGTGPGLAGARTAGDRSYNVMAADSWGAELLADLDRGGDDILVDKHRISGFWDTPLDAILRNLDVTTLFFAGVNTDHCVLGTLMDANFHGYDTILLEDCTGTTSPDFCYQAALHNVRFCFGFTATAADFAAGVAAGSGDTASA